MQSLAEENYLKTIYKLFEQNHAEVSTNEIASAINTKAASVTDMLKRLSEKRLINYVKYQGVTLTSDGLKAAINIIRKHRLWEVFLVEKLGFTWDEVHEFAEELEHVGSEKLINRLEQFLGFPQYDPHGEPIPNRDGIIVVKRVACICDFEVGYEGIITGVGDDSMLFLQYLDKIKLRLGSKIKILEKNEYDGSMLIVLGENQTLYLSKEVSKNLLTFKKE